MNDETRTELGNSVCRYFTSKSPLGPEWGGVFFGLSIVAGAIFAAPPLIWFGANIFGAWFRYWLR